MWSKPWDKAPSSHTPKEEGAIKYDRQCKRGFQPLNERTTWKGREGCHRIGCWKLEMVREWKIRVPLHGWWERGDGSGCWKKDVYKEMERKRIVQRDCHMASSITRPRKTKWAEKDNMNMWRDRRGIRVGEWRPLEKFCHSHLDRSLVEWGFASVQVYRSYFGCLVAFGGTLPRHPHCSYQDNAHVISWRDLTAAGPMHC